MKTKKMKTMIRLNKMTMMRRATTTFDRAKINKLITSYVHHQFKFA